MPATVLLSQAGGDTIPVSGTATVGDTLPVLADQTGSSDKNDSGSEGSRTPPVPNEPGIFTIFVVSLSRNVLNYAFGFQNFLSFHDKCVKFISKF